MSPGDADTAVTWDSRLREISRSVAVAASAAYFVTFTVSPPVTAWVLFLCILAVAVADQASDFYDWRTALKRRILE